MYYFKSFSKTNHKARVEFMNLMNAAQCEVNDTRSDLEKSWNGPISCSCTNCDLFKSAIRVLICSNGPVRNRFLKKTNEGFDGVIDSEVPLTTDGCIEITKLAKEVILARELEKALK